MTKLLKGLNLPAEGWGAGGLLKGLNLPAEGWGAGGLLKELKS